MIGSDEARAWGRVTRARNKDTILKATEAILCGFQRTKLGNDGEVGMKGGRAPASGSRDGAGGRGRTVKREELVVAPCQLDDLSFMVSEMNCTTTSDVTRWRDRENVVKVAAAVGMGKQTDLQRKTVFP